MKHIVRRLVCLAAVAGLSFGARAYELPEGYIPISYLESTGEQTIDPNLSVQSSWSLSFEFATLGFHANTAFFGIFWGGSSYMLTEQSNNNGFYFWADDAGTPITSTFYANTDYTFTISDKVGTLTAFGHEPVEKTLPLRDSGYSGIKIFSCGSNNAYYRFKRLRLWNASGALQHDFVPCIKVDGATEKPGLLNIAGADPSKWPFYTASGFVCGTRWFAAAPIETQYYDGLTPCRPAVSVTRIDTGAALAEGSDYRVEYGDNNTYGVQAGSVKVIGLDAYAGNETTLLFDIVEPPTDLVVDPIPDQVFDGIPVRPNLIVRDKNDAAQTPLEEGTDYDLDFRDNQGIGTAKVFVRGKNGYAGAVAYAEFKVVRDPFLPPDGYVRLQSITADGQQTISTGFTPDANTIVTNCLFCYTARPPAPIGGCLFGGGFGAEGFILEWQEQSGKQSLVWFGSRQVFYETDPIGHEMEFSIGPAGDGTRTATLVVDGGERQVFTGLSTKQSGALSLFSAKGGGNRAAVRFYRTTFMSSSTTVARDFVPALRLADNKVGVYDMANSKFYPNEGTSGDFQAGPSLVTNMVISSVEDGVTEPEHPYRPPVTVTLEGSDEPLTEGVDYRLVWPETKSGLVYLYALGIGKYSGAYASTSYRQFMVEPFDEWLSSTTIPTFTTNIGCRHVYVFDYTDAGKTLLALRQTMTLGDALVVGGGGAGGWTIGGGGGGGGVLQIKCSHPLTAGQGLSLSVGAGGPLDLGTSWAQGKPGTASSLDIGVTNYVAFGGGGGGKYQGAPTATGNLASAGGYGDEPKVSCVFTDGEHYSSLQGNPGGVATKYGSGGGGGAGLGQSGGNGVNGLAGNGGEGVTNSICGYPMFGKYWAVYGSGGGGGAGNSCATPNKGGTNAGYGSVKGSGKQGDNAVNGFGGGGGGGSYSGSGTKGGAGGHGRVILSFFAGDTSGKTLAVEPLKKTLVYQPMPRVYDPSNPEKVLRQGVDYRYEWRTNNPRATRENPGQGVVIAVGIGDYAGVSADTWYDSFRPEGLMITVR